LLAQKFLENFFPGKKINPECFLAMGRRGKKKGVAFGHWPASKDPYLAASLAGADGGVELF
jgi:hypothetical protein